MKTTVHGIHHVTAIAGDPQENLDFYVKVMGMRLVKKSVNQDAPDTYHLFYADAEGSPGTDLTFFPWPGMRPGQSGTGLAIEIPFAIPNGSMDYWQDRFSRLAVDFGVTEERFGETCLPFKDPHGLQLALVETDIQRPFVPWDKSPVPSEHQLRGMHSVRLWENRLAPTQELLTTSMGFSHQGTESNWSRYVVNGGGPGKILEIRESPGQGPGRWGTGAVHHVAWRVTDSEEQMNLQSKLFDAGLRPTEQIDRFWFKSVYFREPGQVLFELATDGPGFDRDEDKEKLGEKLILPPWLESDREKIEAGLIALRMP